MASKQKNVKRKNLPIIVQVQGIMKASVSSVSEEQHNPPPPKKKSQ